ncbi:MAG: hypothetical protein AVDCRST_MAG68-1702, partial [uncultured Gemmatimonadetes bacterium]
DRFRLAARAGAQARAHGAGAGGDRRVRRAAAGHDHARLRAHPLLWRAAGGERIRTARHAQGHPPLRQRGGHPRRRRGGRAHPPHPGGSRGGPGAGRAVPRGARRLRRPAALHHRHRPARAVPLPRRGGARARARRGGRQRAHGAAGRHPRGRHAAPGRRRGRVAGPRPRHARLPRQRRGRLPLRLRGPALPRHPDIGRAARHGASGRSVALRRGDGGGRGRRGARPPHRRRGPGGLGPVHARAAGGNGPAPPLLPPARHHPGEHRAGGDGAAGLHHRDHRRARALRRDRDAAGHRRVARPHPPRRGRGGAGAGGRRVPGRSPAGPVDGAPPGPHPPFLPRHPGQDDLFRMGARARGPGHGPGDRGGRAGGVHPRPRRRALAAVAGAARGGRV